MGDQGDVKQTTDQMTQDAGTIEEGSTVAKM